MANESLLANNVRKIAVLRSGALGDFIVTLPALRAIRKTYPNSEITLLGKPWLKDFLAQGRTPVDRFFPVPVSKGLREEADKVEDPAEIEAFFSQMIEESFDIAIQFQGKGNTANPYIKKLGAKLTVGMTCAEAEAPDRSIQYYYYQSEICRHLEVARLIGATDIELEPSIGILDKDLEEANKYVDENQLRSFIILHPLATDVRRSWPLEKFTSLADRLIDKGYQVVFSGSSADNESIAAVLRTMKNKAVNCSGKLSLGGLAALMTKSKLVISSDTGPLHLARAVEAKTAGIYWAPNLINWGPLSRTLHRPVVSWEMNCPECGIVPNDPYPFEPVGETCNHLLSFARNVKVDEVLKEAEILLQ